MLDFLRKLFDSDFMPHGHCYFWRPEIVWLHVASDALVAASYYMIPFSLVYLVRKRKDLVFHWMFILFGVFILACGTTHLMSIWTLWHGTYRLDGMVKAITALASFPTALLMFRLVPQAIKLPSPEQLRHEIDDRRRAEDAARKLNAELEDRVASRTAALKRSNDALRKFAYVASHDLQEPIRMVATYNQLLEKRYKGQLGADADAYIGFAIEGSKRMAQLVTDLLDYAETLDANATGSASWVNPTKVLKIVEEDLRIAIAERCAEIHIEELPEIYISPTHLKQIFQNLISNALKYSRAGLKPVIDIRAEMKEDEWLFSVRDNGVGFDMKYHDQIFDAFKRLHTRDTPGSGVGLSICRNVVELYGGRMWAESAPGSGSTFCFTVPVSAAKDSRWSSTGA
jgi:signal transduction histidine kinase